MHVEAVRIHFLFSNNAQPYKHKKQFLVMFLEVVFHLSSFPQQFIQAGTVDVAADYFTGDCKSTLDRSEVGSKPKLKELVWFICGTPHLPS